MKELDELSDNHRTDPFLNRREYLLRRLLRPESYVGLYFNGIDRIRSRSIESIIDNKAERLGPDFFVLQIGANDGVHSDPIRQFIEKYNWRGLLVEPNPHMEARLKTLYQDSERVKIASVAVSDESGSATLFATREFMGQNPLQGKDSLHKEVLLRHTWATKDASPFIEEILVTTTTPKNLMEDYEVERVDFLVIDTEGHDKLILDGFDLETMRPAMVMYEHCHLDKLDTIEARQRFTDMSYQLIHTHRDTFAYIN